MVMIRLRSNSRTWIALLAAIIAWLIQINAAAADAWEDIHIGGFIRGSAHYPAFDGDDSSTAFGPGENYYEAILEIKAEAVISDTLEALVNPRYRLRDISRDVDDTSLIGENADEPFDLREAYVRYRGEHFDFTAGQQIISWGVADSINPTDKLSPKDLTSNSSDPDDKRLGIPALKGELYLGVFTLTGVWQPLFVDSKFRLSRLPEGADITINRVDLPEDDLDNSTAAAKIAATFGSTDFSLSYVYGWETTPDIILAEAVMEDEITRVRVTPVFNRMENFGADIATVVGPVILRAEAAYNHILERGTRSKGRRKSSIQWIAGPEWSWFEDLTVNVQYGQTYVLDHETIPDDESDIGDNPQAGVDAFNARLHRQLNETTSVVTLRLDYRIFQDTLLLQFRGIRYLEDRETRLRPRIVYDITDRLEVTLGASLSYGPDGSRFEKFGANYNEVYMELKYSF